MSKLNNKTEFSKEELKEIIETFIACNEDNKEDAELNGGYEKGYYEGVHDAFLDVLNKLEIDTEEEYYN